VISPYKEGVKVEVLVQPRAARNEIVGPHGESLKIRLKAPPVEGKANQALVSFLAKLFGVSKQQVKVLSGLTSRRKSIYISGVKAEEARKILGV